MSTPLRLLVIEDRPRDAELVIEELRRAEFEPEWVLVQTREAFLTQLEELPDVILADYNLPQFSGLEAIRLIQEQGLDIPLIVVSGTIGEDKAVECIQQGAADYLLKDRLARLGPAVSRALAEKEVRASRREAQEALRQSEERFRRLAENAPDVIYRWRISPPGLDYVSPAVYPLTGYSPEEFMSQPDLLLQVAHPEDRSIVQQMMGGKRPHVQVAFRVIHREGKIVWLERRSVPVLNENGHLIAAEGIIRDITDRVMAEAAQRESLARLSAFAKALPDLSFILDQDGTHIEVIAREDLLLINPAEQLLGRRLHDVLPTPQADLILSAVRETIRTSVTQIVEYDLDVVAGHRWLEGRLARMDSAPGEGERVVLVSRDITDRKLAEQAIRESEERFRQVVENIDEVFWLYDMLADQYLYIGPGFDKIWGVSRETIHSRGDYEALIYPGDQTVTQALIKGIDVPTGCEYRIVRPDGEIRWIGSHSEPIRDAEERIVRLAGIAQDITERKQAEKALEERARQLVLINQIGRHITNVIELDLLLERTATLIQQNFGYDHVGIFMAAPDQNELLLRAKAGDYATRFPAGHRMKIGQGMIGWVAQHGERILANDVSTEPRFYNPLSEDITRAELDVPIKASGELLGVLGVQSRHVNAFTDNDIVVIETLADQVAIAIDNARLFATERDQRSFAEALADSASALNTTLDLNEVLNRILDNVGRVLPHDAMTIMLVEGGVATVACHAGYAERGLADAIAHTQFVIRDVRDFVQMADSGHSIYVEDTLEFPGWVSTEATAWVRSSIGAPIRYGGDLLGFINLNSAMPNFFHQDHAARLQAFADQAATAIRNAMLYQELESYSEFLEQAVEERTAQLRATTNRVETILSSVGDALIVLHLDGRIQQVNPAFERQTGYSVVEAELQDYFELLGLDFGSKGDYLGALEGLKPGEVWQHQATVQRKDGSAYEADFTFAPVRDDAGSIRLLVVSIRDITPLKAAQRAKDEFVANVSHELRTPITGIKLSYSLLSMNPERRDVYMERMGREINRLNELIEDLLRLTRLEQGRVELALGSVDLNTLGSQLVDDRTPVAETRQLSLTFEAEPGLEPVTADAGLLGQAVSVLLTNSINYTSAGGKIVVKVVERTELGKRWSGLSVSDTGPGITPDEQPKLFTRFYRGAAGRASGAPGTGLGLSIARQIVERHSGKLELYSQGIPGKGTTFTIWLPVGEARP